MRKYASNSEGSSCYFSPSLRNAVFTFLYTPPLPKI